jgi:hypothetical protein
VGTAGERSSTIRRFECHRTRASFENDRRRDAALLVAERPVLRITQRRLGNEPERLRAELAALPR